VSAAFQREARQAASADSIRSPRLPPRSKVWSSRAT
jgi:hypothetical protein